MIFKLYANVYITQEVLKSMEKIMLQKSALADLMRIKEEFEAVVESIELLNNSSFVQANTRAREQIIKRDFASWNEL